MDDQQDEDLSSLADAGIEVVGAAYGAGVGLLVGGPAGAVAGAMAGPVVTATFRSAGRELKRRFLSHREEGRIGGLLLVAATDLENRIRAGRKVREDWFPPSGHQESAAEEAIEQALLIARDAAEERKVAVIGRLLAGICVEPTVSAEQAQHYLAVARGLTYRQMTMLSVFANGIFAESLRSSKYDESKNFSSELLAALSEIFELINMGALTNGSTIALSLSEIVPSEVRTQGVGAHLFNLSSMGSNIDTEAVRRLLTLLSAGADQASVSF